MAELNLEAERALFEAEMRKTYGEEHFVKRMTAFDGLCYDSTTMSGAWKGWQAARRAVPAQAASDQQDRDAFGTCLKCLDFGEVRGGTCDCAVPAQASAPAELNDGMHASIFVKVWGDAGGGDAGRTALAQYAYDLGAKSAAQSPSQGEMDAGPRAPVMEKYPHGWDGVDDNCRVWLKAQPNGTRLYTAPSQPEASADKLAGLVLKALDTIEHSMLQARNPGNDRLREINLTLNTVHELSATLKGQQQ